MNWSKLVRWFKRITPKPIQPFVPRSNRVNLVLRRSQTLVGIGIGYQVAHVGFALPVVAAMIIGVAIAKAFAFEGWIQELVRHR